MADIDQYYKVEKSMTDLDSDMVKGDLGLKDWVLEFVDLDTIVLSMTDIEGGLKQQGRFMYSNEDVKAWRHGEIIMVGEGVKNYKVGDTVIFPGIRGLETGELHVLVEKNGKKEIREIKNGYFISEYRILGRITPYSE